MDYRITTPEQVTFRYEIAGLASRALAWLADQVLLWCIRLSAAIALNAIAPGSIGLALALIGVFAVDMGYYVLCELTMAGQSPGKRLMRVRVISADGARLAAPTVWVRNLLRPVDTLPMFMVLGGIVALIDPHRRRLGDLAAGTMVVRDVRWAVPAALLQARGRDNSFQADPAVRGRILARVTRAERDLLYDLMLRRDALEPTVREALFGRAAAWCRGRFALPEDQAHLSDEQTVLNVALVVQGQAAPATSDKAT